MKVSSCCQAYVNEDDMMCSNCAEHLVDEDLEDEYEEDEIETKKENKI